MGRESHRSRSPRHHHRERSGDGNRNRETGQWKDGHSRRERDGERVSRFDDPGEDRRGRRDERDRGWDRSDYRTGNGRQHMRRDRLEGLADTQRGGLQTEHTPMGEKPRSRWGNAEKGGSATGGGFDNRGANHPSERTGGVYGPAGSGHPVGGGARGYAAPRDESWVEHRLKLRAEARPPRGVWNSSPSPPKRKEPKSSRTLVIDSSKKSKEDRGRDGGGSQGTRRVNYSNASRPKGESHKSRRKHAPSVSSSSSRSTGGSSDTDNSISRSDTDNSSGDDSHSSGSTSSDGSRESDDEETPTKRSKRPFTRKSMVRNVGPNSSMWLSRPTGFSSFAPIKLLRAGPA